MKTKNIITALFAGLFTLSMQNVNGQAMFIEHGDVDTNTMSKAEYTQFLKNVYIKIDEAEWVLQETVPVNEAEGLVFSREYAKREERSAK